MEKDECPEVADIVKDLWDNDPQVVKDALDNLGFWNDTGLVFDPRATQYNKEAKEFIFSGGLLAIVRAMERFKDDSFLQFLGCTELASLALRTIGNCCDDTNNKCDCRAGHGIAQIGGIEVVLAAMRRFPEDVPMQQVGCEALDSIVRSAGTNPDSDVAKKIFDLDGVCTIVAAIKSHADDDVVRSTACKALVTILNACEDAKLQAVRAGTLAAVASSLDSRWGESWTKEARALIKICWKLRSNATCFVMSQAMTTSDPKGPRSKRSVLR